MNYLKRRVAKFVSLNKTQDTTCSLHEEMFLTSPCIRKLFLAVTVYFISQYADYASG